jgi:pimeloyl-ACP methyl ester carboxylesterase
MNIYCIGRGSPTVILDAGAGYTTWTWRKVQPQIAKRTKVCSYDRAGMGFSDGAPLPRDANATVNDLHALLHRANIQPPYVLVGHSIAGLYEPLFADRYPHEVVGMVLVDPSFPYQYRSLYAVAPAMKRLTSKNDRAAMGCYRAAVNGTAANDNGDPSPLPPAQTEAMEGAWLAGHDSIARRSSVGVNFLVHQSGHFIQDDRPSVVISAIAEVLEQARP